MSESLALTNDELLRAALNSAGLGRDIGDMDDATEGDLRAIVRSGLRRAVHPMTGDFPYRWRWLERFHPVSAVAPYETGTVDIVSGVITLTGGTWPTWAADAFMSVDGHIVFVSERTSDTLLATDHTELTVADSTFILYRFRYPLPSDFAEWAGKVTYSNQSDNWFLAPGDEGDLRLRYSVNYNYNARTSHYAITGTPSGDFNIVFWPVPEPDAMIQGVYHSSPEDNLPVDLRVPGVDPIVQCAPIYAEAFIEAILAAAESYQDDNIGIHEQRYQIAIASAIAHDKTVADGFDFSRNLGRRMTRQPYPTSIDFTDQITP